MLTVGSVCSGIAAPETAWRGLPLKPLWFAEIDPFPSAVLAHRFPQVPNHGDFTALLRPENRPADVDVLVGGTPCQAFSVAGLRGGLTDPRGNLALAFVALVDVLRPRWVLWENVPGVLSSGGGRDFGAFLGALGHIGYGFAYRVLDAQYFGLAQRRKRVFVVASPGDWRGPAAVLLEPESVRWDSPPRRRSRAGVAGSVTARLGSCGADDNAGQARHIVAAGVPDGGDAGEPVTFEPRYYADRDRMGGRPGSLPSLRADGSKRGDGSPCVVAYQCHGSNVGEMGTLRSGNQGVTGGVPFIAIGLTEDRETARSLNAHPTRMDLDTETFIAHTLRAEGHDASEDGTGRGVPLVPVGGFYACAGSQSPSWQEESNPTLKLSSTPAHAHAATTAHGVRRLTPTEMERLQGFPAVERRVTIRVCGTDLEPWLHQHAPHVVEDSYPSPLGLAPRALVCVRIDSERREVRLLNPRGFGACASDAALNAWYLPSTAVVDTVLSLAPTMRDVVPPALSGAAASPMPIESSSARPSGISIAFVSGREIADIVSGAESAPTSNQVVVMYTTSPHGAASQAFDSTWTTRCFSVARAIAGCIPREMLTDSYFDIDIVLVDGWTFVPYRNGMAADGPRAKALGNSMAVPVLRWIGERILAVGAL